MHHLTAFWLLRCRRYLAALLFAFLLPAFLHAGEPGSRLPARDLIADVDLLEQAYTTLHPGLYRYATAAQTSERFQDLRRQFRSGASLADAYLAFARFAATVRCGHTQPNFHNQTAEVQKALFESGKHRLPFYFRWLDGRMVVVRNGSTDASLVPGTEVRTINGVSVAKVLARLMAVARADGSNDAKRVSQMQVLGEEKFEAFDVYLPLVFPQFGDRFRLQVRSPDDARDRVVRVDGMTLSQRQAMQPVSNEAADAPAWALQHPRPGVALLRMPNWALFESQWDWRADLEASFASLAGDDTSLLIIDLRGNEGGLSVGDVLLSHLVTHPLPLIRYRQLVRYRTVPDVLRPHLKTWDASFKDWGDHAQPYDARYFTLTRWQPADSADLIQPKAPRYGGKVAVLVDAANSSATFEFANQVKASGVATLIGQTTGGNRRGINGSAFFFLRLPRSGIELDLPLVGQFPLDEQPDAGIEPDLPITISAKDVASGRDAAMDAALALLDRKGP